MTGTNCDLFTRNQSRSYLNHLVSLLGILKEIKLGILLYKEKYHGTGIAVGERILVQALGMRYFCTGQKNLHCY